MFIYLLVFAALSLYLSPVAAIVSGMLAQRKGLNPWVAAMKGAMFCALFMIPWVYFALSLLDRSIHVKVVIVSYCTLYTLWFIGPVLFSCSLVLLPGVESIGHWISMTVYALSLMHLSISLHSSMQNGSIRSGIATLGKILPFVYLYVTLIVMDLLLLEDPSSFLQQWLRSPSLLF